MTLGGPACLNLIERAAKIILMSGKPKRCRNSKVIATFVINGEPHVVDGSTVRKMKDKERYLLDQKMIQRKSPSGFLLSSSQFVKSPESESQVFNASAPAPLLIPDPMDQEHITKDETIDKFDLIFEDEAFLGFDWNF